jgi:hypothetical protein
MGWGRPMDAESRHLRGNNMSVGENGNSRAKVGTSGTGQPAAAGEGKSRPRRLVLLAGGEQSAVERVLAEYTGAEGRGKDVHADIEKFAAQHPAQYVAAEWLGPLGWARFLWCHR